MNSRVRRSLWLALAGIVLVIALRPIASDDLWWDLCRGREVVRGTFTPSRDLLALDEVPEADWLGGVPVFLAYSLFGSTGLMLVRLSAATGLAWFVDRSGKEIHPLITGLLVLAGLIGAERALDVGPRMYDALGVVTVFCMARYFTGVLTLRTLFPLVVLFTTWSNFGPRVIAGWLVLAGSLISLRGSAPRLPQRSVLAFLIVAAGAMCLTPRGPLTIRDSLYVVFPQVAAESWVLEETPWKPLFWSAWGPSEVLFLALSCAVLLILFVVDRQRDRTEQDRGIALACLAAQVLPWLSIGNLELANTWLVLLIGGILNDSQFALDRVAVWTKPLAARPRSLMAGVALLGGTLLFASGGPRALTAGMGWGLDGRLDNRLLSLALTSIEPHGTAFTDNVRSAGMMCWLAPTNLQIQDVPQRALLGGRLRRQQLTQADLLQERQSSYWRDDGSEGGWWVPLSQLQTSLLVMDADDAAMIRALEPTIWKPLSLDATVLPYAAAGNPTCNELLVATLRQRQWADIGTWSYSPPRSTGSEFDRDRWGLLPEFVDPIASLRQARVFRAMQLPVAALRVLHPTLAHSPSNALRAEFAGCQLELAHRESVTAGRPSLFRALALRESLRWTDRTPRVDSQLLAGVDKPADDLLRAVDSYPAGDLSGALRGLPLDHPESNYAAACIAAEGGQMTEAVAALRRADRAQASRALALLIASRLEELEGQ